MATSITDVLGEDILFQEIFLRLPVKSIFTLRSVCKSWNAVVSSPSFVAQHLNWGVTGGTRRQSFMLLDSDLTGDKNSYSVYQVPGSIYAQLTVKFPNFRHFTTSTVDAVHGVVCIASTHYLGCVAILWNPFIHKHVLVPIQKTNQPLGFGFCSSTNDFKLVRIGFEASYKVFSVQDQSWRQILVSDHLSIKISTCLTTSRSCFAHGNIHWLLGHKEHEHEHGWDDVLSYTMLVFDCEREEFSTMELPPDGAFTYVPEGCGQVSIFRFDGKLSVLKFLDYGGGYSMAEVWVMGEYGVPSTWYKPGAWLDDKDLNYTKSSNARVFEESMFLADSKGPSFSCFKKLGLPHTPDHDWIRLDV